MAISLYVYNANAITDETKGYQIWSAMTQPKIFDIPNDLIKLVDDWKADGRFDLDTRIEHRGDRDFGAVSFTGSNCATFQRSLIPVELVMG